MKTITLVTGSHDKLRQWQQLLPPDITLEHVDYDLPEIQSADPVEIATEKARAAYAIAQKPIVVEDVSAGLTSLSGLPGPFIKYFEQKLGPDALYKLAHQDNAPATVSCVLVYFDGTQTYVFQGDVSGTVVSPRGDNGFGFDVVFMPSGSDQTYAEMLAQTKNSLSHRAKAVALLVEYLKTLPN